MGVQFFKKITDLAAAGTIDGTEQIPFSQAGKTVKTTLSNLATFLANLMNVTVTTSLATAATVNLAGTATPNVLFTGTTGVSSFGNVTSVNLRRWCSVQTGFTITHSASLVCPGATSLTLAAGDKFIAVSRGTNLWEIEYLERSSGLPSVNPTVNAVPLRQTVVGGPVDTNGYPSFLPATSGSLSITSQNVSASSPLVVSAANGYGIGGAVDRVGQSTSNLTWSGLTASTTCYLYVDVSAAGVLTPGFTTLAPTYRFGGADVVTNGQFTFNIQEMVGKVGNGATAAQTYRVFVGEVVTSASAVTSSTAYAYLGRYVYDDTGSFPTGAVSKNHNLGVSTAVRAAMQLVCATAELGYSVGDVVEYPQQESGTFGTVNLAVRRLAVTWNSSLAPRLFNLGTGAGATNVTAANWRYRLIVQRAW